MNDQWRDSVFVLVTYLIKEYENINPNEYLSLSDKYRRCVVARTTRNEKDQTFFDLFTNCATYYFLKLFF